MDIATVPHMEFDVVGNEAEEVVIEHMTYLKEKADTALLAFYDALNGLRDVIADADMPNTDIPYDYIDDTIESDIDQQKPDRPDFPDTNDVDPPERLELIDVDIPIFPDIPGFSATPPDETFEWNETIDDYQSALLNAIKDSLLDWIQNGGTGLAESIEEGIFERARTRLTEEWEAAYEKADTYHSSRGFNIPHGPKNFLLRRVNADFERKLEDLNQEIARMQAELAQNNTQFAHTLSVQLEKNLSDHFNAVMNRLFEAAKQMVVLLYEIFKYRVDAYVAEIQGLSTEISAKSEIVNAQTTVNKGIIEQNISETQRYGAEINAVIAVIDGLAKIYASDISMYEADVDLEKIDLNAKIERLKALVQQSANQTGLKIKEADLILTSYIQSLGLNVEVSKALATLLSQIAAGALSAIHTHASLTDQASRSFSGSYRHDENLGNSKSLQHHYTIPNS